MQETFTGIVSLSCVNRYNKSKDRRKTAWAYLYILSHEYMLVFGIFQALNFDL